MLLSFALLPLLRSPSLRGRLVRNQSLHIPLPLPAPDTLHNLIQPHPSLQNIIQPIQRNPATVVRHPLLPPIIRPHFVPSPHPRHAHNANPHLLLFFLPRFAPLLRELGTQDLPCFLPVLVLRAGVLDGNDGGGGDMCKSDCGVRRVDVLPAGAAGAHDVRADVGGGDVVIAIRVVESQFSSPTIVGETGQHEHRSRRRVRAT